MLENFENLRTSRFAALFIAIFVPIWLVTIVLCLFIYKAQSIHLKIALLDAQVEEVVSIIQDIQQARRQLEDKKSQFTQLTNAQPENKADIIKLKEEVSAIQLISEDKLNQVEKKIESLKSY